jgi:tetratricopeptide (TPR) repeat protein
LEQTIATQRANDSESARKTQELTMLISGTFGLAGLSVILLMFYFQWRGFSHLAQVSAQQTAAMQNFRALPTVETVHQLAAPGRLAIEGVNGKLLETVERLEKRIVEMEQSARGQLTQTATGSATKKNGSGPKETVANLMADGQTLLNANQPENALKLFEQALSIEPSSAEVLVKKGGALEKLSRTDEAVACYDRAIQLNETLTIAYLQKGGLFSRLARYDEALMCYEQALLTQDKLPAAKSVDSAAPV